MRVEIAKELERIRQSHPMGLLVPVEVLREAADPVSPLHDELEWDNNKAGHEYRLNQIRTLIREVTVEYAPYNGKMFRVYASLREDRVRQDGGYRVIAEILSSDRLRVQLLDEALREMNYFRNKYRELNELAAVFAAMAQAQAQRHPENDHGGEPPPPTLPPPPATSGATEAFL